MLTDYNEWHASHDLDDDITAPWHQFVKQNLETKDVAEKKILEIGCGRGGFANYLASIKPSPSHIFACDYSETAIALAQAKYSKTNCEISWQKQDIMKLTFESNTFDTVISCETIEHVPNPQLAIKELYRVLKPGGKLLLTCPNYFNVFGIWCFYRWLIKKPFTEGGQPYVNYVLMPQVSYWLSAVGFRKKKYKSTEIIIPARVPKHFWNDKPIPRLLSPFGYRTYYSVYK